MQSLYTNTKKSFLRAVDSLKIQKQLKVIDRGYLSPDKEKVTTEFLKIGNPEAKNFFIISSGTVGVDFYLGSQVQTNFLSSLTEVNNDVGIVIVHGVSPWGAAWLRPGNINNVNIKFNSLIREGKKIEESAEYKKLEDFINPHVQPNELKTGLKSAWYIFRMGYEKFLKTILAEQRSHPLGINYTGLAEEAEIEILKETVLDLLPSDYNTVVHIDIRSSAARLDSPLFLQTEDDASTSFFKDFNLKVYQSKNQGFLSTLKDLENWHSAYLSFYSVHPFIKFRSLRDENLFHNLNIWTENWSRGELSFWPIDSYINSKAKQRLLKSHSASVPDIPIFFKILDQLQANRLS